MGTRKKQERVSPMRRKQIERLLDDACSCAFIAREFGLSTSYVSSVSTEMKTRRTDSEKAASGEALEGIPPPVESL